MIEPRTEPKEGTDYASCDCKNTYLCVDSNVDGTWSVCEFCEDCGNQVGAKKITQNDMESIYYRR